MSIQVASYVRIRNWQSQGHLGLRDHWEVSVVTQGGTFYPMAGPGYGSAGDLKLPEARRWADSVASMIDLEVRTD